jgi:hypothetical protein
MGAAWRSEALNIGKLHASERSAGLSRRWGWRSGAFGVLDEGKSGVYREVHQGSLDGDVAHEEHRMQV